MRDTERGEQISGAHRKYGRRRKKRRSTVGWRILPIVQVILTIVLIVQICLLNMLPLKYLIFVIGAMVILAIIPWLLTSLRNTGSRIIGTVISVVMVVTMGLGNFYVFATQNTLGSVTGATIVEQTDEVAVVVLDESKLMSLADLEGTCLGIQSVMDRDNTDQTLEDIKSDLGVTFTTQECDGLSEMVDALYDGTVDAIVFNEVYREMITEEYENFNQDTRVLETYTYTTYVQVSEDAQRDVDVVNEPFILYMSGIDTYGSVTAKSRSDVNIMAVVNPKTKQILLITTPRDYYVELPFADYNMDKLTHAGIYGIDRSVETLEYLYDIDIDYYFRLNFTGFMNIVDALGGVTVYSEKSFTGEVGGYSFTQGYNEIESGEEALSFVRERHSFGDGDNQRARNQMAMIQAIIQKAASPAILSSYTTLLGSLEDSFTTDMTSSDIAALVKMQLSDNADWNIQSFSTVGTAARRTTYSMGNMSLFVYLQDDDSVAQAKELISMVQNGQIIDESMLQ